MERGERPLDMAQRHKMLQTRGRHATREYAVAASCRIPKGITAGQVLEAVAANTPWRLS